MGDKTTYTTDVDDVIHREKQRIEETRTRDDIAAAEGLAGLAFSGGGIRSAALSLGVIQALVSRDKLRRMDYLSTVSGGGYIGSALTWYLNQQIPHWMKSDSPTGDAPYFGTSPETFPFVKTPPQPDPGIGKAAGRNAILNYLRQHGNYLIPGRGLNAMALLGYSLRAMTVSVVVYLAFLTVLMVGALQGGLFGRVPGTASIHEVVAWVGANWFLAGALIGVALFFLLCVSYSLWTRFPLGAPVGVYRYRVFAQRGVGALLSLVMVLAVVGSLKPAHQLIVHLSSDAMRMPTAGGSLLTGVVGALSQYKRIAAGGSNLNRWIVISAGILLVYGMGLTAYWLAEQIIVSPVSTWGVTLGVFVAALVVGVLVNINHLGMHRMYRDRLMETFLPNLAAVRENQWALATEADTAPIQSFCTHNPRPYHLLNTNLVLVDSPRAKYRGRGGDNFILSPLYCGSDATGWRQSGDYMQRGYRNGMTLPTAMAISGAAVNPDTGEDGKGVTRDRVVASVLSLLNIRLGFWAPHPNPRKSAGVPPNFLYPAFTGSVIPGGLNENRRTLELSDGGHFENLALYELIRRRVQVIVCVDGGADPRFHFGDLGNLLEKVRADFGASIEFRDEEYSLSNLLPGSASEEDEENKYAAHYQAAKNGFALGAIDYGNGHPPGCLIYIKATLIKDLPVDLVGYKTANPSFPDQSTTDQFFDERQFEAYRELGFCLGWQMLDVNESKNWF